MSPPLPCGPPDHAPSPGEPEKIATVVARTCVDVFTSEHPRLGHRPAGTAVRAGKTFRFDPAHVRRTRPEPGAGPACAVHACAPPLTGPGRYAECEDGLPPRHPSPAEEQPGPGGRRGTPTTEGDRS